MSKNLRGKYGQLLFDHAKQSATDAFKTASKRAIQKTEATAELIRKLQIKLQELRQEVFHRPSKLKQKI